MPVYDLPACGLMKKIVLDDEGDYLIYRNGSGGSVEIVDIAVHSIRGQGRGKKLIELLLDRVRINTDVIYAMTRASNTLAHKFYKKRGFVEIGQLDNLYCGEDAVVYAYFIRGRRS